MNNRQDAVRDQQWNQGRRNGVLCFPIAAPGTLFAALPMRIRHMNPKLSIYLLQINPSSLLFGRWRELIHLPTSA